MRDKLNSLPMSELREIAKSRGIKSVTNMRKEALITKIIESAADETDKKADE